MSSLHSQYKKCNINKCICIVGYCDMSEVPLSLFYVQIWDSIHYYSIHIFEIGLRKYDDDGQKDIKISTIYECQTT